MKDKYTEVLTDLEKHSPKTPTIFAAIDFIKEQRAEIERLTKELGERKEDGSNGTLPRNDV